jgi:hypothetical protein
MARLSEYSVGAVAERSAEKKVGSAFAELTFSEGAVACLRSSR